MSEIAELRARANAGEADAMTDFGKRLLVGGKNGPPNIPAGAHYVLRAAEAGNAEAMTQHAALVAGGIAKVMVRGKDDAGFCGIGDHQACILKR